MAWIRTIPRSEATGTLKEAYDWQAKRLGEPTEFTQLGSLYPEMVMTRLQLYKTVEGCPSGLSPIERQMAALVTSVLNETPHCSSGLCLKLESLGADRRFLDKVCTEPRVARAGSPGSGHPRPEQHGRLLRLHQSRDQWPGPQVQHRLRARSHPRVTG